MKKLIALSVFLLSAGVALAASTINPNIPAANAPLASQPVRSNFGAAYNDVNSILGQFNGATAPAQPSNFQYWLNTNSIPYVLSIYDGSTWLSVGQLNPTSHTWSPSGSYIGSPVTPTYGGTGQNFSAANGAVYFTTGTAHAGTLPNAYIPVPGASALGGVNSLGQITHQFLTYLDTSGNLHQAQPIFADLASTPTTLSGYGITDAINVSAIGSTVQGYNATLAAISGANLVAGTYGGTGINNGSKTITLGASITTTGAGTPTLGFGSGSFTYTYPAATSTLGALGVAQSWTAAQTFTNSDLILAGSSTGVTTFTSDNDGASNFTLHFPAANDTLVTLAATQTLINKSISGSTNTLTNIGNSSLTNSAITLCGTSTSLGGSLTASACLDNLGSTQGDILYRNGSSWVVLAPGANGTILQSGGAAANPSWISTTPQIATAPTIQKFTSGSGTYTTPAGVKWIEVRMVGGGGGGAGGNGAAASTGGNTTFGTTLLVANGGTGGTSDGPGGTGGTASLGSGPIGLALQGGYGQGGGSWPRVGVAYSLSAGGNGGVSCLGGAGGSSNDAAGAGATAAIANSGSGGAGGQFVGDAGADTGSGGGGGGAGGCVDAIISAPSATYSYAVGALGAHSAGGTAGAAGADGALGFILVTEHYNY